MSTLYPSDLSDTQWAILKELIPPSRGGRHRTVDIRKILNGIRYLTKSGCQWRMIPKEYGPWETLYYYFDKWKRDGTWEDINDKLAKIVRVQAGKKTKSDSQYS